MNIKIALILLVALVSGSLCDAYSAEQKKCDLAGSFYSGDPKILDATLAGYLQQVELPHFDGEIIGAIAPHAGYSYSGIIAAYTYKALMDKPPEVVVILAQSHRHRFSGISIYPAGSFDTPLGALSVDEEVSSQLSALVFSSFEKQAFVAENALETQLPFIKKTLSSAKIVPLVFGEVTIAQLQILADKLAEISKKKHIVIVASTDLSHYLSYDDAVKIDTKTIQRIKDKDFYALGNCDGCACGVNPVIAFIFYSKLKGAEIKMLTYANSGDTSGDRSQVVGYVSAVAYCPVNKQSATAP
ncbi:MAG: AmmeMemoRadiSam system protein B [Candidatus Omnitrophota bacterium]